MASPIGEVQLMIDGRGWNARFAAVIRHADGTEKRRWHRERIVFFDEAGDGYVPGERELVAAPSVPGFDGYEADDDLVVAVVLASGAWARFTVEGEIVEDPVVAWAFDDVGYGKARVWDGAGLSDPTECGNFAGLRFEES